ncbi:MAG TPA: radical SAM protein [Mycobacteriales bacterium]|nr:radical SAM protein [Mycobacteriales bacterium]
MSANLERAVNLGPTIPGREPEWPETLDVPALLAHGWEPTPFREFVLKIHSRCDLACDHCYMYKLADKTWRSRPVRMPPAVVAQTATRIVEHVHAHGLTRVTLIMHGGELLLAGPELIAHLVTSVRDAAGSGVRVDVSLQTNGIGLDDEYLRLFDGLGVQVGVSVDGDATAPMIDLLLPHGTWTSPPPERLPGHPTAEVCICARSCVLGTLSARSLGLGSLGLHGPDQQPCMPRRHQGAHVSDNTTGHDDGLIDVSELTLRQLADEVDESSLTHTLRQILNSSEGDGGEIAGWSARL